MFPLLWVCWFKVSSGFLQSRTSLQAAHVFNWVRHLATPPPLPPKSCWCCSLPLNYCKQFPSNLKWIWIFLFSISCYENLNRFKKPSATHSVLYMLTKSSSSHCVAVQRLRGDDSFLNILLLGDTNPRHHSHDCCCCFLKVPYITPILRSSFFTPDSCEKSVTFN